MGIKEKIESVQTLLSLVSKVAISIGSATLLAYCLNIGYFPKDLTIGDGLTFILLAAVFGFVYLFFISSLMSVGTLITEPLLAGIDFIGRLEEYRFRQPFFNSIKYQLNRAIQGSRIGFRILKLTATFIREFLKSTLRCTGSGFKYLCSLLPFNLHEFSWTLFNENICILWRGIKDGYSVLKYNWQPKARNLLSKIYSLIKVTFGSIFYLLSLLPWLTFVSFGAYVLRVIHDRAPESLPTVILAALFSSWLWTIYWSERASISMIQSATAKSTEDLTKVANWGRIKYIFPIFILITPLFICGYTARLIETSMEILNIRKDLGTIYIKPPYSDIFTNAGASGEPSKKLDDYIPFNNTKILMTGFGSQTVISTSVSGEKEATLTVPTESILFPAKISKSESVTTKTRQKNGL